jgi:hypothetical protein
MIVESDDFIVSELPVPDYLRGKGAFPPGPRISSSQKKRIIKKEFIVFFKSLYNHVIIE